MEKKTSLEEETHLESKLHLERNLERNFSLLANCSWRGNFAIWKQCQVQLQAWYCEVLRVNVERLEVGRREVSGEKIQNYSWGDIGRMCKKERRTERENTKDRSIHSDI